MYLQVDVSTVIVAPSWLLILLFRYSKACLGPGKGGTDL